MLVAQPPVQAFSIETAALSCQPRPRFAKSVESSVQSRDTQQMQYDGQLPSAPEGPTSNDEPEPLEIQYRHDYGGCCWWCGNPADSREHKYKKTDAKLMFGAGPWRGENAVVRGSGSRLRNVQGPDSNELKFTKVLCATCNSARSKSADNAYDVFATYVMANTTDILESGQFSWSSIFEGDWRIGRDHVTAYWLKHIGCCLAENGVKVDSSIGRYIDRPGYENVPLALTLEIRDDIAKIHQKLGTGSLWKGTMYAEFSISRKRVLKAWSHLGLSWLRLNYTYEEGLTGVCNFGHDIVELPRGHNLDPIEFEKSLD